MYRALAPLLFALSLAPSALAQTQHPAPLPQLLRQAGADAGDNGPGAGRLNASPTRDQQLPLFRAVMERPLDAPYRAGMLAHGYRQALGSPHSAIGLTGAVAGLAVERQAAPVVAALEQGLRRTADPLAASLLWMAPMVPSGRDWPPALPDLAQFPSPLRFEVALVLSALSQSHQFLQRAFARLPAGLTPALLRRQAFQGKFLSFEVPDYRQALPLVEREALLAGMLDLVAAVERLQVYVRTAGPLPAVAWTLDTPMGLIVVDTTGKDNRHRLQDPLLVLDVGGSDEYEFLAPSDNHRISVLLDHRGNDRYVANAPGADPSSATLGLGILWDTEGDDQYIGAEQAQASALFGAALLVDGGGTNAFVASGGSQAHAIGGIALLLSGSGNDQFTAQTHSQASAGPQGVAVLIDAAGNDRYTLNDTPLIAPSRQLPEHNSSMGQGAGYGVRADFFDGRSAAGGIGMLLDLAGDDHYVAQVFAQGVGFYEGLGLLVDDGGNDRFDAAWYVMGAAAHSAAGVMLKGGSGNDAYRASHSISMGAAHDFSVGVFLDEGGNDGYRLGDLGLGAAHDNSTGLFVDGAGDDRYEVAATACRALGATRLTEWGSLRESFLNLGLFMDLGGTDSYPAHCARAANNLSWSAPRSWPLLHLRSEAGAGLDGEWPLPFAIRPLTREPAPGVAR